MTTTTKVREDSTDTLVVYPPMVDRHLEQPSGADVRIGTPSTTMPAEGSEEACTVDPTSTTVSAQALRGATSLILTSATDVVEHRNYLIVEGGKNFVVNVKAKSGSTVFLDEPLLEDIASGAAFVGIAVTHQLTTAETSQSGKGLAIYRLTIGGVVVPRMQDFYIDRHHFPLTLTADRLLKRHEVRRLRSPTDPTLSDVIEEAWQGVLRRKLRAHGIYEDLIQNPVEVEDAHIEACLLLMMRAAGHAVDDLEAQELRLNSVIDEVKASIRFVVASSDTDETPEELNDDLDEYEYTRLVR